MSYKVLILGGARFLGYRLAQVLSARNVRITVLNRGKFKSSYHFPLRHLVADRHDRNQIREVLAGEEFDAIIDNSAYKPSDIEPLIDIIKEKTKHYILSSSVAVYLKHHSVQALSEEDVSPYRDPLFDPRVFNYAQAKLALEKAVIDSGIAHASILRFPNIFGEHDFSGKLRYFADRRKDNAPLLLEAEIQKFSFVYVDDAVRIIERILMREDCFGQVFNCPSDHSSYAAFFSALFEDFDEAQILKAPTAELRRLSYQLPFAWSPPVDDRKLRAIVDFELSPLSLWLGRSLEWEKKNLPDHSAEFYSYRELELQLIEKLQNVYTPNN